MNERVRNFLKKATSRVNPEDREWLFYSVDQEKFAELLIQECIEIVNLSNTQSNSQWDKALTFAANSIKENFGF